MRVVGLDPGLAACGIAVLEEQGHSVQLLTAKVLRTKPVSVEESLHTLALQREDGKRLHGLSSQCRAILEEYSPQEAALEHILFAKNRLSAMRVAQARGALLALLGELDIVSFSYSPKDVKKTLTGYGAATKEQVFRMVQQHLQRVKRLPNDASDAVAIGLCHLQRRRLRVHLAQARRAK